MPTLKRHTGSAFEYIGLPVNIGMSPQTLGYAEVTANQGSITTEVDLTGLAVNVIVPAGRRIRITASAPGSSTVVGDTGRLTIKDELNNNLQSCRVTYSVAARSETHVATVVISPSAGTHTYRLAMARSAGTGTLTMGASSGEPAFILVEDVTGSTLPYQPASVPVGRIAYAEVVAQQTGITAEVDLTGLSVNVAVPAGRTIRVTGHGYLQNSAGGNNQALTIYQDGVQVQSGQLVSGGVSLAEKLTVTWVGSPSAGAHTYKLRALAAAGTSALIAGAQYPAFILVEDITPTPAPSSGAPSSTLAYAEVTANQGSITTGTDLTGLSVAVTVPAGRRLRISGKVLFSNTAADNRSSLVIYQDGVQVQAGGVNHSEAAREEVCELSVVLSPASGSHTYKLQAAPDAGTTTMTAGANHPAFILVEDITGSVWPEGSAVTTGMVASEAWTDYTPTLTQPGAVTKTVTYARYSRIGRTVTAQGQLTVTGTGTASNNILVGLPFAAAQTSLIVGSGLIYDSSAGLMYKAIVEIWTGALTIGFHPTHTTANDTLGSSVMTAALASGDLIEYTATYEAAS